MNRNNNIYLLAVAALLSAVGIVIPLISPFKIIMEPASFTLASHVAIFIAMMIAPWMGVAVSVVTAIGFFATFPLVVGLRAATHVVFALAGGLYLKRFPQTLHSPVKLHFFSFFLALVHAACELVVVALFYFGGNLGELYYQQGFLQSVLLLVGLGSVIHSMVDFEIAFVVMKALSKTRSVPVLHNKA